MRDNCIMLSPVEVLAQTELAWRIEYEEKMYWVPKSECEIDDDELEIPFWMAEDKGMI